jgi:hypothetical protein
MVAFDSPYIYQANLGLSRVRLREIDFAGSTDEVKGGRIILRIG